MPTISQAEINRLAYKQGVRPEDIASQLQSKGYTAPATTQEAGVTLPGVQQTTPVSPITTTNTGNTIPPVTQSWDTVGKQKDPSTVSNYLNTQSGFKTTVSGNTVTGTKNGVNTTWIYDGANWVTKPTIATGDSPVIGTPPATTPTTTTTDFTVMTPEQLKSRYMEIGTKLPGEVTDEDRKFTRYLQTRMSLGEAPDVIFGTKGTKSSGTTTYSTELTQPGENIASSVRNSDGTYKVTYKDGTTQTTTSEPSKTIFPEGTPEYFAQKQADEANKRLQVLEEQLNTEAERRKKETADLVAKYGENIATQFQNQKADIEANGAKRMDAAQSIYSFSGFGRSSLAAEKRDEIAKNIETTINQAKAKADLELMAYRMEREGADQVAIAGMRKNIADVQQKIDDANYANQLKIIELNQQNATTGAEAMNNLLATISDSEEIVSNADLEKSQMLGYFVNKDGSIMLDSQKRPIQFEGNPGNLDPSAIGAYADALSKGIIDEKGLDKLSPSDKAAVLKHVSVKDNTYVPTAQGSGEYTMAKIKGKTIKLDTVAMPSFQSAMAEMPENTVIGAQQFRTPEEQARLKAEGKSWTLDSNHMKGLAVDIYDGDPSRKPSAEQIAIMNKNGWYQDPALMAKGDYGHFDYKGVGNGGGIGQNPDLRAIAIGNIAFGKNMSDGEREAVLGIIKKYPNTSNQEIALLVKNMYIDDPKNTEKALQYLDVFKNMENPPAGYEAQIARLINQNDFAGLDTYLESNIERAVKNDVPADEFISRSSYDSLKQNVNLLQGLIDRNKDKIGTFDGRVADFLKKFKADPEYQQIKTLLSMSVADVRRKFAGSAVTETEMKALEDFIGGKTTWQESNLQTYLKSMMDKTTRAFDNQRSLYRKPDINNTYSTTPTGQAGVGGTVTAGAFDLDA